MTSKQFSQACSESNLSFRKIGPKDVEDIRGIPNDSHTVRRFGQKMCPGRDLNMALPIALALCTQMSIPLQQLGGLDMICIPLLRGRADRPDQMRNVIERDGGFCFLEQPFLEAGIHRAVGLERII